MREAAVRTLSEHASKRLLAGYGVAFAAEALAATPEAAVEAAAGLGFPVVAKLCGDALAHKSERGLVRLGLATREAVRAAAEELLALRRPEDGDVQLLVAEQVRGLRELIAGVVDDPVFGPCVMLGLGGVQAEALEDVAFAAAPLDRAQALRLVAALRTQRLLGPFRGEPALDREALAALLVALGRVASERSDLESVDLNPLVVRDGRPIAVDALVALREAPRAAGACRARARGACRARARGACRARARGACRGLPRALPPARRRRRRSVGAPGEVRLRGAPPPAALRLRGRGVRAEPRRHRGA